jgi:hypothetical protein
VEHKWTELLKAAPVIFVEKNGENEETYGKASGWERMWEVTAAGMAGRYSLHHRADEYIAAEAFKKEFNKCAERKGIDWERWEIILLAPND